MDGADWQQCEWTEQIAFENPQDFAKASEIDKARERAAFNKDFPRYVEAMENDYGDKHGGLAGKTKRAVSG